MGLHLAPLPVEGYTEHPSDAGSKMCSSSDSKTKEGLLDV